MKKLCFALALVLLVLVFASCGGKDASVEKQKTEVLYVYNWGEYISDGSEESFDTNAEFEAYCREVLGRNVKVNYSTFSSNEDMYAKVSSGAIAYDVLIPSDYTIERMVNEQLIRPLDLSKIPNYRFISDDFKGENVYYECGTEETYSIPYFYGMIGIIYNTDIVSEEDAEARSWDLMWNENYRGDILQFNNSRDASGTALYKLGYSVNDATEEQWAEALELLKQQKELVQSYVMDEIFNKMKSGSAAISAYYAGDFFTMYEDNDALAFYYPVEGTNSYIDCMCIPTNAQNPDLAHEYINFMCRPDVALANAAYTYYASPLDLDYIEEDGEYAYALEEYRESMEEVHEDAMDILYGEASESVPTEAYLNLSPEGLERLNALWEELKVESSIGTGIYVLCGIILACLVALAVFLFVRKRKWEKLYD